MDNYPPKMSDELSARFQGLAVRVLRHLNGLDEPCMKHKTEAGGFLVGSMRELVKKYAADSQESDALMREVLDMRRELLQDDNPSSNQSVWLHNFSPAVSMPIGHCVELKAPAIEGARMRAAIVVELATSDHTRGAA